MLALAWSDAASSPMQNISEELEQEGNEEGEPQAGRQEGGMNKQGRLWPLMGVEPPKGSQRAPRHLGTHLEKHRLRNPITFSRTVALKPFRPGPTL